MATHNKRARRQVLPLTTFAGDPSVVTYTFDTGGANQVSLLFRHTEGTSATALTAQVFTFIDASTSDGEQSGFTTDLLCSLSEEDVDTATGVVTLRDRSYSFESGDLDADLPVLTFPVSTGVYKLQVVVTETATAAGTLQGVALCDDV